MRRSLERAGKDACEVSGCQEKAERSLSRKKVEKGLPDLKIESDARRIHICKAHYREYKKATKDDRKMESLRR
ncbi:MAG: hypothetical protein KAX31_06910 [Thermoplasmata archaeon]|nr:hypothetical protein [Thermoplasmata archaeon]